MCIGSCLRRLFGGRKKVKNEDDELTKSLRDVEEGNDGGDWGDWEGS